MATNENKDWLCRNCNNLVSSDLTTCPHCNADKPEESHEPTPEGINEVVERDNYTNATPRPKSKYIFREAVLVNAADITLILGLFLTFGALIAPLIVEFPVPAPMLWAICAAVLIFATTMVSWAIMKSIAEISRQLRELKEREQQ
jgi:hypothetical protein